MRATGSSFVLAILVAGASGIFGPSPRERQPPASLSATLFRDIARRQNPGVVSVIVRSGARARREDEDEGFRLFDLFPPEGGPRVRRALGSGFVINGSGEILTNNHVIEGAERIEVSLFGNERQRYRALLVGRDPRTDTALIRLENPPPNLQPATLGDSSALEPGDWVMAIGNPFGLGHSATVGIVSFPRRPVQVEEGRWQDLIQTDASINLGNSGGPLFDVRGEVVGINVAMIDADTGGTAGIGFAIPINTMKAWLPQLRTGNVVRGQLGVEFHGGPILEDEAIALRLPKASGAIVMTVSAGSAAERAGVRPGDVIVDMDGVPVADTRDLIARTAATPPGTRVTVKLFRDGEPRTRTVTIEEQPVDSAEEPAAESPVNPDDGLTLGEMTPTGDGRATAAPAGGALVLEVAPDSPADEAELTPGDIVQAINGRAVRTLAEARRALDRVGRGRPVFLLVSRHGTTLFLQMRRN
jgi:serine protease Do